MRDMLRSSHDQLVQEYRQRKGKKGRDPSRTQWPGLARDPVINSQKQNNGTDSACGISITSKSKSNSSSNSCTSSRRSTSIFGSDELDPVVSQPQPQSRPVIPSFASFSKLLGASSAPFQMNIAVPRITGPSAVTPQGKGRRSSSTSCNASVHIEAGVKAATGTESAPSTAAVTALSSSLSSSFVTQTSVGTAVSDKGKAETEAEGPMDAWLFKDRPKRRYVHVYLCRDKYLNLVIFLSSVRVFITQI